MRPTVADEVGDGSHRSWGTLNWGGNGPSGGRDSETGTPGRLGPAWGRPADRWYWLVYQLMTATNMRVDTCFFPSVHALSRSIAARAREMRALSPRPFAHSNTHTILMAESVTRWMHAYTILSKIFHLT